MNFSRQNIHSFCRVCLTQTKYLTPLNSSSDISSNSRIQTLNNMLEAVTHVKICVDATLPSSICQMCLSMLKLSFQFYTQFTESQKKLETITSRKHEEIIIDIKNEECNKETKSNVARAPVELIFGKTKVDLKDVIVVEDESEEKRNYEGFLKNLGSELSAKFVNKVGKKCSKPKTCENVAPDVVIEKIVDVQKPDFYIQDSFKLPDSSINLGNQSNLERIEFTLPNDLSNNSTIQEVQTIYVCDICTSMFENELEFNGHLDTCRIFEKPVTQFVCEKCGHLSSNSQAARRHLQKHKGRIHRCHLCPKSYYTSSHLKIHMAVHANKRNFLCNICGKSFNYAVGLQYHMRLHSGEKKYVCNFCGLRYTMANTLKRHIRTHTHDKPYICIYCDKRFSSMSEKKCHEQVHTGEKTYYCEYCRKGFIKSSNRALHYLSHSGSFECYLCPKSFVTNKILLMHMKRSHGEDSCNTVVDC